MTTPVSYTHLDVYKRQGTHSNYRVNDNHNDNHNNYKNYKGYHKRRMKKTSRTAVQVGALSQTNEREKRL